MEERRKSQRIRSFKGGSIVFMNGAATRDCAVKNLSAKGAKLTLESIVGIPDHFILQFEDGTQKESFARWRSPAAMGLEFRGNA
jgi:hypothetical protein